MIYVLIISGIAILAFLSKKTDENEEAKKKKFGKAGEHFSMFNKGFSLVGGLKATTMEQAFRNALVVGSTGSGKTSAVLLGSLFTLSRSKCSIVILDVSSENYKLSSGYLSQKKKRTIYCFDFTETSDGFNPLTLCKTIDDIHKVAHVLIKNAGVVSSTDPYWSTSSEMVLSVFMQYLFFHGNEEHKNMANVVLLMETYMADPEKVDMLFLNANDSRLMQSYKSLNAIPEKTRLSILSTALSATKLFKSPVIARCTSVNTFDIATFRKTPSVLYLCIPLNWVNFLAPLTAVLFEMLFQEVLSKVPDKQKEYPIFFLIDEMMSMKLDLELVFPHCRKYLCGCMGLVQDEKMLEMKYTHAESFAIKSNACSRVYLPGQSLHTCRELQELIGKYAMKDDRGNEKKQYVMEASDIRTSNEAILLINASLPLKRRLRPYYNHFLYHARTKIPPYVAERKIPFNEAPLMEV